MVVTVYFQEATLLYGSLIITNNGITIQDGDGNYSLFDDTAPIEYCDVTNGGPAADPRPGYAIPCAAIAKFKVVLPPCYKLI